MKRTTQPSLAACLEQAGLLLSRIAADGGGVWLFGSRAAGCARGDSDWDLLVVSPSVRACYRSKVLGADVNYVPMRELPAWSTGELAGHVAEYGIRIDDGRPLLFHARPSLAAPRKQALVASRSERLRVLRAALQPRQFQAEILRLRRNAQRGWLLSRNFAVPPTVMLDEEWSAAAPSLRESILSACNVAHRIAEVILSDD